MVANGRYFKDLDARPGLLPLCRRHPSDVKREVVDIEVQRFGNIQRESSKAVEKAKAIQNRSLTPR